MKPGLLLALCLLLQACTHFEDDYISKYCPGSCTVIEGRLTTDDGAKPLTGVKVKVIWNEATMFGGTVRTKAVSTTDQNGFYSLRFLLRDKELPNATSYPGDFAVEADIVSDQYVSCGSGKQLDVYATLSRNTTYTLDYLLPQKAYLVLEASNLGQMGSSDVLVSEVKYNAGINGATNCMFVIPWKSDSNPRSNVLEVAANQPVTFKTSKRKNNTETVAETTLTLQPGQRSTLSLTF